MKVRFYSAVLSLALIGTSVSVDATSKEDLLKIMDDARAYGLKKPMPQSFPDLTEDDKKAIVEWMIKLK